MSRIRKTIFRIPEECRKCPIGINPIYGICKACKYFELVEEFLDEPNEFEVLE